MERRGLMIFHSNVLPKTYFRFYLMELAKEKKNGNDRIRL